MAISSNIASLQANQTFMNVNANNIANSNTEGFTPSRTTITEGVNAQPQAQVSSGNQARTDLNKEINDQVIIGSVNDANIAAIKTQDEMLGSLLDIKA